MTFREFVRSTPIVGPLARRARHKLLGPPAGYPFERIAPVGELDRVRNLIEYTKVSGSRYAADRFPAGYHTLRLDGVEIAGQRDPAMRLQPVVDRLQAKCVLDIGCNQGGMLFALRDNITRGVGVDYDPRLVNAANRIRTLVQASHLDFYVFDLTRDPLPLLDDLLPDGRVDVVFMLSVAMWIPNWREVVEHVTTISDAMLFESNGTDEEQTEQESYLRARYRAVELLTEESNDDPGQKRRRLFYASG